jgi:thiol:disulfide interchange protein DsbA
MKVLRRRLSLLLALGPIALAGAARAQPKFQYTELKPPQPVAGDGKIHVIYFFWYGCIHCYNLEPYLEKWAPKLPADALLTLVPAVFNERWARDAASFYTFEALGVLDKVHRPFFDAIHRERLRTDNPQALAEWLARSGIDARKFDEASKSFGVQSKVRRAAQLSAAYRIEGTPALAVQGRYTVSPEQGRTREGMLATVDHLIGVVRKQR